MSIQSVIEKGVCRTVISRPDTRNAINFDVMDKLEALLTRLEEEEPVRVFVFTGSDDFFISGGDLREFHGITKSGEAIKMGHRMQSILERIEKLPCWTIAAINGPAYGGGWEMMLAFDFRIAVDTARFGFTQGRFYLPPGWGGLTRLCDSVGRQQALWLLSQNKIIGAGEALKLGLIQSVFPTDTFGAETDKFIQNLGHNGREYIRHMKEKSISEERYKSIYAEIDNFGKFWEHEEHLKRVDSFLNK
jgi:enoyl-CoA hydratase/carnithine racemase